jgi:spermidine/putrescine transport system permease protein
VTAAAAAPAEVPAPDAPRARGRAARLLPLGTFAGPGALWLLLFVVIPYAGILVFSFWKTDQIDLIPAFTLSNLQRAVTDDVVHNVLLRTAWIAGAVTVLTFLLAFPLAYLGAFFVRRKALFVFLVVAPMWVSYIVRLYSWRLLLGEDGLVNEGLLAIGLIDAPLSFLLFSPWAVILTLTYVYMPFMFVSLFVVMDGLDRGVLRAASDLYASPWRRFTRVTLPLAKPGVAAGTMLVFPLAFGDYIAPGLVGGTGGQMFANLVQNQFGTTFNYPFGAALAVLLLVIVTVVLRILERWRGAEAVRAF